MTDQQQFIQPRNRNWKLLAIACCVLLALAVCFMIFTSINGRPFHHERPVKEKAQPQSNISLQHDKFTLGYKIEQPPAPPPPAPVIPVSVPPQVQITRPPPVPKMHEQKSKHASLTSPFISDVDPAAASFFKGQDQEEKTLSMGGHEEKNPFLIDSGYAAAPTRCCLLQAGTVIPASAVTRLISDLPGDIVGQVTNDIYDTPTGGHITIPAGARIYGTYTSAKGLSYGQSRLEARITRLLFPNGASQSLGDMTATDAQGASGIEGDVDRHPWAMAGAVTLSIVSTMVGQAGTIINGGSNGTTNIGSVGTTATGNEAEQIGRQIAQQELKRPNTLTIEPGTSIALMLNKDIMLPEYNE